MDMNFLSFLLLTIISAVVTLTYHDILRYRFLEGMAARVGKLIVGWFGAWLGSLAFGNWLWRVENVYVVPAVLGAVAAIHLNALMWRGLARLAQMRPSIAADTKEEIRPRKPVIAA
jgi:uncharacterized membrane protein YeaQ/YmgE (transglycosylase-associated protein family)